MKTIVFGIVLLVLAVLSLVYDPARLPAFTFGLTFGLLLGPARLAGVDFRQWFRDPGTPSEIGDDTFIGLVRGAFHAMWGVGALALLVVIWTACDWSPDSCKPIDAPGWPDWLRDSVKWLAGPLNARPRLLGGSSVLLGTIPGIVASQMIVEGIWRLGLKFVPRARRAELYLAPQEPPHIRQKGARGTRRLIVCCDGTWNWPESRRETNVVRLVRSLAPNGNGTPQIIHYHQGVGTGNFIDRAVGGGAGVGLTASVKACYGFLADNYFPGDATTPPDEIFIFGFSRGAFVARALSGLIGTIGMLRKSEMPYFNDAWNWYWQDKATRDPCVLETLAPNRAREVDVECIGVWDTVGALGIPGSRFCAKTFKFHETELGLHVRHAFQALAIDERRGNFQGAVWVPYDPDHAPPPPPRCPHAPAPTRPFNGPQQVLKQVWFPGVHSNIGGGYPEHGMSDASFLWMAAQLESRGLLAFNQDCIVGALAPDADQFYAGGTMYNSRSLFFSLIGCPMPRPVCIISKTEEIHESAWLRGGVAAVPSRDSYKKPKRHAWLTAMDQPLGASLTLKQPRLAFEVSMAAVRPRPQPLPIDVPVKQDFCSRLIGIVSSR